MDSPVAEAAGSADRLAGGSPDPAGPLSELLALETIEVDTFRAPAAPGAPARLFGGQVAAQALFAAVHTVTGARPHSLHAYFLRPGDSSTPVLFQVDRLHDGRTFRRRRVTAIQQGQPILCLESSFTTDDSGLDDHPGMPVVPAPEDCPRLERGANRPGSRPSPWTVLEARTVPGSGPAAPVAAARDIWFRLRAGAITESIPHEVVVAYLSDLTLAATSIRPTQRRPEGRPDIKRLTSLDHSVWFHNPARLSGWLLFAKTVPAVGPLRGIVMGQIFNRDGTLVATVAQETLLRLPLGTRPRSAK
jgi:acyl-CoA thioesterase-2